MDAQIVSPLFLSFRNWIWRNLKNNAISLMRARYANKVRSLNFPTDYVFCLETVTVCNAKCIFCPYSILASDGRLKNNVMPIDLSFAVIKALAVEGFTEFGLSPILGDISLDPFQFARFEQAKEMGLSIIYTTNGIRLKHQFKELIDFKPKLLAISFQGFDSGLYKEVYGVDRYSDVLEGIILADDYNKSKGSPVPIQLSIRSAQSFKELLTSEDFVKYIKPRLGPQLFFEFSTGMVNWGGIIKDSGLFGNLILLDMPKIKKLPCHGLRAMRMLVDGRVRICGCAFKEHPGDDMIGGKFPDWSLRKIADSSNLYITEFRDGKYPEVCKSCSNYTPLHRIGKLI